MSSWFLTIEKKNQKYLIIEGHFSDIIPDNIIDFAFVLRCDPEFLYNRLKERDYNKKKIIKQDISFGLRETNSSLLLELKRYPVTKIISMGVKNITGFTK